VYALKPETKKQNEVMKPRAGSDVQVVTTAISDGDILGYFRGEHHMTRVYIR
jgi:hypothetical protein